MKKLPLSFLLLFLLSSCSQYHPQDKESDKQNDSSNEFDFPLKGEFDGDHKLMMFKEMTDNAENYDQ